MIYSNIASYIHKLSRNRPVLVILPDIESRGSDILKFLLHLINEIELLKAKIKFALSLNGIYHKWYQEFLILEAVDFMRHYEQVGLCGGIIEKETVGFFHPIIFNDVEFEMKKNPYPCLAIPEAFEDEFKRFRINRSGWGYQ